MRRIILLQFFILCLFNVYSQANNPAYRIYGEITTIENKVYKGYITWGDTKNYWINFFEAQKIENPYSSYFSKGDGVVFRNNNNTFAMPPTHSFCCRFGNIQQIRLTGENEIKLQLKNKKEIRLRRGNFYDIGTSIQIITPNNVIRLKWEHISEVRFMASDESEATFDNMPVYGTVKSPQGLYKGLISWNHNNKNSAEKDNRINLLLNRIHKIIRDKSVFKIITDENNALSTPISNKDLLFPINNILINMPNTGSVLVPGDRIDQLEILPSEQISMLSYTDFREPQEITGEVITREGQKISGKIAYDLDETYDFEILDGKNDYISYKIPFKYIRSIEPKNYKYSFVTLRNGSQLSLGETPDVNNNNSGVIIFRDNQVPVYIVWEEIKIITFE